VLGFGLLALSAVPVLADADATFVLTNGQRVSGPVIYGREDNNIVDGRFNLGPRQFEMNEVAVIDFEGGTPNAAEASSVPNDSPSMVMRDGTVVRGHLHNIIKGDYVQWVNEAGQRNNFPVSSVRRLYLEPQSARNSFLQSSSTQSVVGTSGALSAAQLRVNGNQDWTDTGIDVRNGDRLQITSTGQVTIAAGAGGNAAAGNRNRSNSFPVATIGGGALIGKVGNSAPFPVGNARQITAPADGRLFLGINDDVVSDNSGAFSVTVKRQ